MKKIFSMFILIVMAVTLLGSIPVYAVVPKEGMVVGFNENYTNEMAAAIKAAALAGVQADGKSYSKDSLSGSEVVVYVRTNATAKKDNVTVPVMALDSSNGLTIYTKGYRDGDNKQLRRVTQAFLDSLKDSSVPADQQQAIMQEIQDIDSDIASIIIPMLFDSTKADLFTAYKWLYPFLSILRVLFGIGAVAIILLLMGSTIMDLAYIGLPMWREAQAEKNGKVPFGVSFEALRTVQEIEKGLGDQYKNAYVLYFKRRALTYVMLSICLLYLIAGELGGLISWLLSLASGIV